MEISILIHHFLLSWSLEFEKVKVAAHDHQIDSLIISFQCFDWISVVSILLESVLRPLEVLKFLWQLSTTSQGEQDAFTHKLVISALQKCT